MHLSGVGDIGLAGDHTTGRLTIVHNALRTPLRTLVIADVVNSHACAGANQT